ncbi:unnamed protein product, partial [Allacma fusca]
YASYGGIDMHDGGYALEYLAPRNKRICSFQS